MIVGRDGELASLRTALAAARAGHPAVVLVTGPPGIGKTALWRAVLDPRSGPAAGAGSGGDGDGDPPVVVVATGDEAEVDLDHGVVDQLLRRAPLDALVDADADSDADSHSDSDAGPRAGLDSDRSAHPEPGRAATVRAPTRRADVGAGGFEATSAGSGRDAVQVGAALVGLVDRIPAGRTLAVVIDDAQWADEQSLRALTFAARRLHDDRVLVCVTCRDDAVDHLPEGLVRLAASPPGARLDLEALGPAAVGELARRVYDRRLPDAAATRLVAHTGGNPLHTCAVLDEVPFEVVARADGTSLPVPRSYASLVLAQVARCRSEARDLVSALAVLGLSAPLTDVAQVAGSNDPLGAVDDLVACGLVEVVTGPAGTTIAFPHGLARASIAADLSPSRLAELHAAAAAVTGGDDALAHRLAAAVGPDPELVAAARARAGALVAEAAPVAAARHLLAAAPLAGRGEREHLVATAAAHLSLAGQADEALVTKVAGYADSALRSCVLGRAAMATGDHAAAERMLVDAWERASRAGPGDDARAVAAPVADLLAVLALHRRDGASIVGWSRCALAAGSRSGLSATLGAHGLAIDGRFAEAIDEMSAMLAADPSPALRLDALLGRGVVRVWSNDLEGAAADLAAVDAEAGALGSTLARVDARAYRAEEAYRSGRWAEALDLAESTSSIVDDAGDPMFVALPHSVAAFVLSGMGRLGEAGEHVDVASANAAATGLMPPDLWSRHAALRLAEARGDHAEVARLGDSLVADGFGDLPEGIHHWRAAHVDALVAVDRLDDAADAARDLCDLAARQADVSVAAGAARASGVVAAAQGEGAAAVAAFDAGLALDPGASRPFVRARLELAAGAHQRRAGNRRAAAVLLGDALARFEALGAAPWVTRCAREAAACGLRPRRRAQQDATVALTSQERLVARLVARGSTNREVAEELVISAKTVEHHLGRVYAKLGLRSRTELAARMAGETTTGGGAAAASGADPQVADP